MATKPFGMRLPDVSTPVPGPRSRELAERLGRVESQNVTALSGSGPLFWARARGANVQDADGNVFVDLGGAFGVAAVGHSHPDVTTAISAQSIELLHGMGDVHPAAIKVRFLEALAALAPWQDTKTILANSGSEAVEAALKTALLATGRPGILSFEGGYHGLTLGSLSATHREHFRGPFTARVYSGVEFLPFPTTPPEAEQALGVAKRAFAGAPDLGTLLLEPIQGRAGVRIPPRGFLADLAQLARDQGAVVVADEVFTGFGRTGALFATVEDGMTPDVICAGKALGGGMPIGACMGSASVMDAWPRSQGEAIHTSTFLGHPAVCASALAALSILESAELVDRSRSEGARWLHDLETAMGRSPNIAEVRGRGLMIGIELSATGVNKLGDGAELAARLLQRGLILLPAGEHAEVLELTPPLMVTRQQMEWSTATLADVLG